ncbi:MAG: patatin-like phospholipase family protein, partial [Methylococcaceae bacterium]|nr:patatin-like phospholipase family protein [Methylococcaceae bacterium]
MLSRIPEHADALRVEQLLAERTAIEAPCNPAQYRVLKRIAANPNNHLAIGFGAGSAPGLAGNLALAGLLSELELGPCIKEVWGVSAGAIIGVAWCSGASAQQMLPMLEELDRQGAVDFAVWEVLVLGLARLLLFQQFPEGLVRGRNFREAIARSLQARTFDECPIPFRVIACT